MTQSLTSPGGTLDAALVLASDIHLQHMGDRRAQLLLDVLARLGPAVECCVLNGDIFDFCLGDSGYFRRKFRPLGDALAAVAARGTRVIFVEGNHEFHLEAIGWAGVDIVTARDLSLTLKDGVRIKLAHGDLITGDPLYRAFRALVKSPAARVAAKMIPGRWLDAYALRHAQVSRAQDRYRRLDHRKILGCFDRWLAEGTFDHGVIGHFHVPYAERRPARAGSMLSVESWDRPNQLVYRADGFHRVFLEEPGRPFHEEPAAPLFG